jgi:DNA-binding NtrC family response regulator
LVDSGHVGTVYLKNPAALPRDLQEKLADLFAEPHPGLPRLISGSHRATAEEAAKGTLISRFHTALALLELRVPPLRERLADLPRLAGHLLPNVAIDSAVFDVLRALPWAGNLRELADALAEAAVSAGGEQVKRDHLPLELRTRSGIDPPPPHQPPLNLDAILAAVEKRVIALALNHARGKTAKAAEMLGIWQSRLVRRLKALDIPPPTLKPSEKDDAEA